MSLQERTLVVKNFDYEKTSNRLLKELFNQAGPVRKVVMKPDHAFVEFEDVVSVGYAKALLDGVIMFDHKLIIEPKIRLDSHQRYSRLLQDYIRYDRQQKEAANQYAQQFYVYQPQVVNNNSSRRRRRR